MTEIHIGNGLQGIEKQTFKGCTNLTSIVIPEGVTYIREEAFYDCIHLEKVVIPKTLEYVGGRAFYNTPWITTLPIGEIYLGNFLYGYNGVMPQNTHIVVKEGTTTICEYAFAGMPNLYSIDIPNSVDKIGEGAFYNCTNLTTVSIPSGSKIDTLKWKTFENCSSLQSFTIPESVTYIGDVFRGCSSLQTITIPKNVTDITGSTVFKDCPALCFVTWEAKNCNCHPSLSSGRPYYEMGSPFYFSASSILSFEFGNEVEVIPGGMCRGMKNLTSIHIPESVTEIQPYAFADCIGLSSLTIPSEVKTIGSYSFQKCTSLTSIHVNAQTPPECGYYCFGEVPTNIPVYVPCGTKEAYHSSTGWSVFTNIIEPKPDYTATVQSSNEAYGMATRVSLDCNNELTVQATAAKEHYRFVRWSDGSTQNPYTLVLTQDTTLTAEFALDLHTITATAENGTVTGSGTYLHGTEVTLTATPEREHYRFVQWSDSNTDNPRTLVVESDITLTAEFEEIPSTEYTVSIIMDAEQHGTVEVTVRAVPDAGFRFIHWDDGDTSNPRTILVTENMVLRATFDIATNESPSQANENTADTRKVFHNGNMYIQRGSKTYTSTGVEVK